MVGTGANSPWKILVCPSVSRFDDGGEKESCDRLLPLRNKVLHRDL